ncbi:hypothetical protein AXY43_09645 [Clostridium sp. MF28]|nr:GNAT family N-acetyltransferase [Clostridium sp. MF28]AVK48274.1 hypothetical protein AXY43_09645 [Clostridium sp. MF28]
MSEKEFNTIDNINNDASNNLLISNMKNTFLTDINFQFIKTINKNELKKDKLPPNYTLIISNSIEYDENILEISKNVYKYSRFYNDPFIDEMKARRVYVLWAKNSFENDKKYFLKLKDNSKTIGYILFNIDIKLKCVNIELIAVDSKYQNRMIGNLMIVMLEDYLINEFNNIDIIKVGTQGNNMNAINLYTTRGFKVREIRTIYHFWNK